MKLQKVFLLLPGFISLYYSINTYASGKQIRPPEVNWCDIDPDSEDCQEESDNKTEENK